jgi:hypothetical protein
MILHKHIFAKKIGENATTLTLCVGCLLANAAMESVIAN